MKQYATDSIKKVLNASMIDQLHQLATGVSGANYQNFRLLPHVENGKNAQLIIHTIYNSGYSEKYVVDSAKPIDATIGVFVDEYSCNLSLSGINMSVRNHSALLEEWSEEDYRIWAM